MLARIKKNDEVVVTAGKNRGKKGKVLRVLPQAGRVIVEGVQMIKVRERARRAGTKGQMIEKPSPISLANVSLFCSACKKGVRMGSKTVGKTGKKVRFCRHCEQEL